jgi:hypothetical protein
MKINFTPDGDTVRKAVAEIKHQDDTVPRSKRLFDNYGTKVDHTIHEIIVCAYPTERSQYN